MLLFPHIFDWVKACVSEYGLAFFVFVDPVCDIIVHEDVCLDFLFIVHVREVTEDVDCARGVVFEACEQNFF